MLIKIEIECETINEFYGHLRVLQKQIKKQTRKLKLDPIKDEFPSENSPIEIDLDDSNCYGTHTVIINNEDE